MFAQPWFLPVISCLLMTIPAFLLRRWITRKTGRTSLPLSHPWQLLFVAVCAYFAPHNLFDASAWWLLFGVLQAASVADLALQCLVGKRDLPETPPPAPMNDAP
jgi:hypothetical protein